MELKEIADNLEKRRIELLKNNAQRAKQLVKDEQARNKMRKAREQLATLQAGKSNLSLLG